MKPVKVATAVLNQTPLDWDGNRANIVGAIGEARAAGACLLCLPEMCVPGYGCEDAYLSPNVHEKSWEVLQEILPETYGMVVSLSLPVPYRNTLFNAACLVVDGRLAGFAAKRNLAGDGIHYEPRWFRPWPADSVTEVRMPDGRLYPLGDLLFDVGGIRIGFEICEDAWVADRPASRMVQKALDIVLNPTASHFSFGKSGVRRRLVIEGSRAFGVTYIYSNMLGNEAGRAIYDGDALIASGGRLLAAGPRFSFADRAVTVATVDVDATRNAMMRRVSFRPSFEPDGLQVVHTNFQWPETDPQVTPVLGVGTDMAEDMASPAANPEDVGRTPWEMDGYIKEEEFARAIGLGLMDYMRKSRSSGFVLSLSGGVDSAACACLVALGVRFGVAELGLSPFLQRMGDCAPELESVRTEEEAVTRILLTVYQATENSSVTTREAAREVARQVGAEHLELDVDPLVKAYNAIIAEAVGRELTWERDDLALQNVQARVRAPGVWMLANLRGALLLSTSNRSEAAVGYATMDGDTAGGLSPIAGIDKAYLRRWLVWLERVGPDGLGPYPALRAVNTQAPTAELRPASAVQTDEKDLMPYDVLDVIERAAIRDKLAPRDVLTLVRIQFPGHSAEDLLTWVERFFKLWCRNQWKRERYAPSFHVDDQNLDPKTWCRFPILSGGYKRELEEMRESAGMASSDGPECIINPATAPVAEATHAH